MLRRCLSARVRVALADTPVVTLVGGRQVGKTTLVRHLASERPGSVYRTLDDASTLAAAAADPTSFTADTGGTLIIDEVQKAPDLLAAIKATVDRDRRPGRFLLTASAEILSLPRAAESLAGRMEVLRLRPLAQAELAGVCRGGFIDRIFAAPPPAGAAVEEATDLAQRVLRGGFPEVLERPTEDRRDAWFAAYVSAILQRDIRDLARIEGLARIPRLLELLAARSAMLLNRAEVSRATGLAYSTLERYLALLEATFLVDLLPAWSSNLGKRLVRAPKMFLTDSGLAAHLVGVGEERWAKEPTARGPLVETLVVTELRRQAGWTDHAVRLYHYRQGRHEVDVVLEDRAGRLVGVEVKADASLGKGDGTGLRALREAAGDAFLRGVVLYGGDVALPFGEDLWALPFGELWLQDRGDGLGTYR